MDLTLTSFQGRPTVPAYGSLVTTRTTPPTLNFVVQPSGNATAGVPTGFSLTITAKNDANATEHAYAVKGGHVQRARELAQRFDTDLPGIRRVQQRYRNHYQLDHAGQGGNGESDGLSGLPSRIRPGDRHGREPEGRASVCPPNVRVSTVTSETVTRGLDAYGNAVTPGAAVTFTLSTTAGGGTFQAPLTRTISSGQPACPPFNYTTPGPPVGTAVTLTATTTAPGYGNATCSFTTGTPVFLIPVPTPAPTAGAPFDLRSTPPTTTESRTTPVTTGR